MSDLIDRRPTNKPRPWNADRWLKASREWVESCFQEPGGCAVLYTKMNARYAEKWRSEDL